MKSESTKIYSSEEQRFLSRLLKIVVRSGLALIVIGFILYVSGALPTLVPIEDVAKLWHLPSGDYLQTTSVPVGWDWVRYLGNGDVLSFATLVVVALAAIVCIASLMVVFARKKNWIFAAIVFVQTLVLLLAASGIASGN